MKFLLKWIYLLPLCLFVAACSEDETNPFGTIYGVVVDAPPEQAASSMAADIIGSMVPMRLLFIGFPPLMKRVGFI